MLKDLFISRYITWFGHKNMFLSRGMVTPWLKLNSAQRGIPLEMKRTWRACCYRHSSSLSASVESEDEGEANLVRDHRPHSDSSTCCHRSTDNTACFVNAMEEGEITSHGKWVGGNSVTCLILTNTTSASKEQKHRNLEC